MLEILKHNDGTWYVVFTTDVPGTCRYFRTDGNWYKSSPSYFDSKFDAIYALKDSLSSPSVEELPNGEMFWIDDREYMKIEITAFGVTYNAINTSGQCFKFEPGTKCKLDNEIPF